MARMRYGQRLGLAVAIAWAGCFGGATGWSSQVLAAPDSTVKRIVIPGPGARAESPATASPSRKPTGDGVGVRATPGSETSSEAASDDGSNVKHLRIDRAGAPGRSSASARRETAEPREIDTVRGKLDLVLAEGAAAMIGHVVRLTGDTLQFDDLSGGHLPIPRDTLTMVSFAIGQRGISPREPEKDGQPGQAEDVVVLNSGEAMPAVVSAITKTSVVTDRATFQRTRVDRVLFAKDVRKGNPFVVEPPPPPPPSPPPRMGDAGLPGGADTPWGRHAAPVKPCPKDKPLGGAIEMRFVSGNAKVCVGDALFRARFPLVSRPRFPQEAAHWSWRDALRVGFRAERMVYQLRIENLREGADCMYDWCKAIHGDTVSGRIDNLDVPWDESSWGSGLGIHFHPLRPSLDFHWIDAPVVHGLARTRDSSSCNPPCFEDQTVSASIHSLGIYPGWPALHPSRNRYVSHPATPSVCDNAQPPLSVDCARRPDYYAVIPFSGSGSTRTDDRSLRRATPKIDIRYAICCGCGGMADEQDFATDEEEDCFEAARAYREDHRARMRQELDALDAATTDLFSRMADALDHRNAWKETMLRCAASDMAYVAINGLQLLANRFSIYPGKVMMPATTTPGPVVWSTRYGTMRALPPSPGWTPPGGGAGSVVWRSGEWVTRGGPSLGSVNPTYILDWKAMEWLIDGMNLLENGPEPAVLRDRLARCEYKPGVDREAFHGAEAFLDAQIATMKAADRAGFSMSKLMQADIEGYFRMRDNYRRCQECATSRRLDASACPPPFMVFKP